jgi:hypothetical protein
MRVTASEEVEQPFPLARERTVAGLEKVLVVVLWCSQNAWGQRWVKFGIGRSPLLFQTAQ